MKPSETSDLPSSVPAPGVTEVYDLTVRTVRLTVTGATEPLGCGTRNQPRRFLPQAMDLEWRNGELDIVGLSGPRVLKNGSPSYTRDGVRLYLHGADAVTLPAWVEDVIRRYGIGR